MDIPSGEPPLSYLAYTLAPCPEDVTSDDVLDRFLEYTKFQGLSLYPAQEEAVLELYADKNVILSTPTGSGKSLVAAALHFLGLARHRRSFYSAPIKALVNEKFFALCRDFGAANVGLLTGDASVNPDANILCCTAEVLANMALREGAKLDAAHVVIDEFHYYADRDRGTAWQVPLLTLPQTQFLLMSATLGDARFFGDVLTKLTKRETALITSTERPVPLDYEYRETPLHETLLDVVNAHKTPVYVVNFTQKSCAEEAQKLLSTDYSTKEEKKAIVEALRGARFDSPYGKEVNRLLRHGIGLHHAGLLPKYRLLVERLAQRGLLKIIVGTDTLGVGINIPLRTVVFTHLCKYDGHTTVLLSARDFHQISGRAGRRGFDSLGSVMVQAPEHVIENLRLEAKASADPIKRRKIVKKKPPEFGYVPWDKQAFERLIVAPPEPLVSSFNVSHGMLIEVLRREQGGCRAMVRLLRDCHEPPRRKQKLKETARQMYQSLLDAEIISWEGGHVIVHADLQEDFSLNRALSLFLVEVVDAFDRESPLYALDLLSMVEAILEDPIPVLRKQLDKIKQAKLGELKAQGVEYEERMEELAKLSYPKPNAEFTYEAFNTFAKHHPWVGEENIRPKSVAREMFEGCMSFGEYVREYALERSEGLLLRYLSDVYKTLLKTVPDYAKTEELEDIQTFLEAIVRATDSSLVDEWERLDERRFAIEQEGESSTVTTAADRVDVTSNPKTFSVLIRNALFGVVRALARRDYRGATEQLEGTNAMVLENAMHAFYEENECLGTTAEARSIKFTRITPEATGFWIAEQVLYGVDEATDWVLSCRLELETARTVGRPVLQFLGLHPE